MKEGVKIEQISLFEKDEICVDKPIRLIELFAGYGSQAMALKRINFKFKHKKEEGKE